MNAQVRNFFSCLSIIDKLLASMKTNTFKTFTIEL